MFLIMAEIRGVWLGDGDQIAASVYEVHDVSASFQG